MSAKKKPAAKPPSPAKPKTVDEYLAGATPAQRAALNKIRKTIRAAAPEATEGISYGIVGFKYKGKRLIYYGHWQTHLSIYGGRFGTMKFTPEKPPSDRVITKAVKDQIAEIDRKGAR
jgi:hypothetical protein